MKKEERPLIELFCEAQGKLWFSCLNYNLIGAIELNSFETEWFIIPYDEKFGIFYSGIVCSNNKLCLVPGYADSIVIFDLISNIFSRKRIKKANSGSYWKYCGCVCKDNKLYCIPRDEKLLCIDLETGDEMSCFFSEEMEGLQFYSVVDTINGFAAAAYNHPGILIVDIEKKETMWRMEKDLSGITKGNREYGICARNERIYIHNNTEGRALKFDLINDSIVASEKIGQLEPEIMHMISEHLFCIDYIYRTEIEIFEDLKLIKKWDAAIGDGSLEGAMYGAWVETKDKRIVYYNNLNGELRIYKSLDDVAFQSHFISIPNDIKMSIVKKLETQDILYESKSIGVNDFVESIM